MIKKILLVVAVILFGLATFGVALGSANVVALGLGVFAGSFLTDNK